MNAPNDDPTRLAAAGPDAADADVLRGEEDLFFPFEAAFRATGRLIGLEAEKFGVRADGSPLHYDAPDGVPALFAELASRFGWQPESESPGGPVLALRRDGASITLEPGSQFELSGAPHETVHQVLAEVEAHQRELASIDSGRAYQWLGLGFHPFARQEDLDWVPKSRYPVMRRYLPTRGANGIDMMRRTATVQANFDIGNERDAMRKLRVGLALSPMVTAMFANSAVVEGVRRPSPSKRAQVWLDVDNARAGLLPFAWRDDAAVGDYVRWALDVPMFILKRGKSVLDATGVTFRQFLAQGLEGHRATRADWESHLNTLFPDVRLKRTLEVRSADGVPARWSMALPAFWAGILYDDAALDEAAALLLPLGFDAWNRARTEVAALGLSATVGGQPLRELALRALAISEQALARRAFRNERGDDERVYLEPLIAQVREGRCIGDAVLGDWSEHQHGARTLLIERAAY